jgi:hypothetical protein
MRPDDGIRPPRLQRGENEQEEVANAAQPAQEEAGGIRTITPGFLAVVAAVVDAVVIGDVGTFILRRMYSCPVQESFLILRLFVFVFLLLVVVVALLKRSKNIGPANPSRGAAVNRLPLTTRRARRVSDRGRRQAVRAFGYVRMLVFLLCPVEPARDSYSVRHPASDRARFGQTGHVKGLLLPPRRGVLFFIIVVVARRSSLSLARRAGRHALALSLSLFSVPLRSVPWWIG